MTPGKKAPESHSILNRRARYEYFIDEEVEAGIVLAGSEVKSLRAGHGNIQDAYAFEKNEEIWLVNAYIAEYPGANKFNHDPKGTRKLLLHKKEIRKLIGRLRTKGVTLSPLKLYFNDRGRVKLLLGVARGKKLYDKREAEKNRDWSREKAALLKKSV